MPLLLAYSENYVGESTAGADEVTVHYLEWGVEQVYLDTEYTVWPER
jgi:hypothetical protein